MKAKRRIGKGGVDSDTRQAGGRKRRLVQVENQPTRMSSSKLPGSAIAGAIPAPSPSFDSAWEAEYAWQLELQKRAGLVKAFWHHPTTFFLPGKVKYTPDFLVQYPDGLERRLQYVEVKGWSKNRRDGVTRYKVASGVYDCFDWVMLEKGDGGRWNVIG